jgi:hypothetical protein
MSAIRGRFSHEKRTNSGRIHVYCNEFYSARVAEGYSRAFSIQSMPALELRCSTGAHLLGISFKEER